jgi:release factor glutamine methyltransferase
VKSEEFMPDRSVYEAPEARDQLLNLLRLYDFLLGRKLREELSFDDPQTAVVEKVAEKLRQGVPVQYILGRAVFMAKVFYCTSDTLIPRPETSLLVETANDIIARKKSRDADVQTVIEIGTGCGNIAVSLALLCDGAVKIMASDINTAAVEIAHQNVRKYGLSEKIELFCGDLFEPFGDYQGNVDMVICNPPYIPTTSLKKLVPEIINHEPVVALDGGPYGIDIFRRLINESATVLKQDGVLVFEIGEGQEKLIERLLAKKSAYKNIEYYKFREKVRVVSAVRK